MRPYKKRLVDSHLQSVENNAEADNSEDSEKRASPSPPLDDIDKCKDKEADVKIKKRWKRKISRKQFRHHDIKLFTPGEYRTSTFLKHKDASNITVAKKSDTASKETITDLIVTSLGGLKNNSPPQKKYSPDDGTSKTDPEENNNTSAVQDNNFGKHHLPAIVMETPPSTRRRSVDNMTVPKTTFKTSADRRRSIDTSNREADLRENKAPSLDDDEPIEQSVDQPENLSLKRRYSVEVPVDLSKKSTVDGDRNKTFGYANHQQLERGPFRTDREREDHTLSSSPNDWNPSTPGDHRDLATASEEALLKIANLRTWKGILQRLLKQSFTPQLLDLIAPAYDQIERTKDDDAIPPALKIEALNLLSDTYRFIADKLQEMQVDLSPKIVIEILSKAENTEEKAMLHNHIENIQRIRTLAIHDSQKVPSSPYQWASFGVQPVPDLYEPATHHRPPINGYEYDLSRGTSPSAINRSPPGRKTPDKHRVLATKEPYQIHRERIWEASSSLGAGGAYLQEPRYTTPTDDFNMRQFQEHGSIPGDHLRSGSSVPDYIHNGKGVQRLQAKTHSTYYDLKNNSGRPRSKSHRDEKEANGNPQDLRRSMSNPHESMYLQEDVGRMPPPKQDVFITVPHQNSPLSPYSNLFYRNLHEHVAKGNPLAISVHPYPKYHKKGTGKDFHEAKQSLAINSVTSSTDRLELSKLSPKKPSSRSPPAVIVADNSMQITKEPTTVGPKDASKRIMSSSEENLRRAFNREQEDSTEFLVWLEKLKSDEKLKSKFLSQMGILKREEMAAPKNSVSIVIVDSDEESPSSNPKQEKNYTTHIHLASRTLGLSNRADESHRSSSFRGSRSDINRPSRIPAEGHVKESLSKKDFIPPIPLPYVAASATAPEPKKAIYSPEIEPISPVGNESSFVFPELTKVMSATVSLADSHPETVTSPGYTKRKRSGEYQNEDVLTPGAVKRRKSVDRPQVSHSPRVAPSGKLWYLRENHMFLRYFDDTQVELFIRNLSKPDEEEFKNRPSSKLPEPLSKTEIVRLPKNVQFSEKEDIPEVEEFIKESDLVERYVPKDFASFYRYVTGFQIIKNKHPVSLQTFLTMYNTNRTTELLRKYLDRSDEASSRVVIR